MLMTTANGKNRQKKMIKKYNRYPAYKSDFAVKGRKKEFLEKDVA